MSNDDAASYPIDAVNRVKRREDRGACLDRERRSRHGGRGSQGSSPRHYRVYNSTMQLYPGVLIAS